MASKKATAAAAAAATASTNPDATSLAEALVRTRKTAQSAKNAFFDWAKTQPVEKDGELIATLKAAGLPERKATNMLKSYRSFGGANGKDE